MVDPARVPPGDHLPDPGIAPGFDCGGTRRLLGPSGGADFERGVISDDEFPIGQGFRSLRNYLILFGVLGILGLLSTISKALEAM